MFFATRSLTPEMSLQRKRGRGLDINKLGCEPASKRHQFSTPWAAVYCVNEAVRPQAVTARQPMPPILDEQALEEHHSHCSSESKASILAWLSCVPQAYRTTSAPGRLSGRGVLPESDFDDHQHPSFECIPQSSSQSEMPPGRRPLPLRQQSLGGTSNTSGQLLRITSHQGYRGVLQENGVRIDEAGSDIPKELRDLLDLDILKTGPLKIPQD